MSIGARRRRELSLRPLAVILLVGALVVVGAIVVASRIGHESPPPDARLLDALVADTRLTTPPGTREVGLKRFSCGQYADSAPPTVVRELRIAAGTASAVGDEIILAYVSHGWQRHGTDPTVVMLGDRYADISGSAEGSVLTITVDDLSVLC